jgi:hypothetical protein
MKISRKDILAALDACNPYDKNLDSFSNSFVFRPPHKRYEIRVRPLARGWEIKYGRPGRFFNPDIRKMDR